MTGIADSVAAGPDDLEEVVAFVTPLQAAPATNVAYLAAEPDGIRAELLELDPPWWELTRLARGVDGQLIGAAFAAVDRELGRAWLHGPWTAAGSPDDLAFALLTAVRELLPGDIDDIELSGHADNTELRRVAVAAGLEASPVHHVLVVDDEAVARWPTTAGGGDVTALDPAVDGDAAARLHDHCFPTTYRSGAQLVNDVAGGVARGWVARSDGELVGYAVAKVQADGEGYLDFVGVSPEARGGGWGRRLVATCVAAMLADDGVPHVALTVDETNVAAVALYRSLGFRAEADIVGYRTPGRRARR